MHNKKIIPAYYANIILKLYGILQHGKRSWPRSDSVWILHHGKHGKHGRNTPLLLISVSSVLSVAFKNSLWTYFGINVLVLAF